MLFEWFQDLNRVPKMDNAQKKTASERRLRLKPSVALSLSLVVMRKGLTKTCDGGGSYLLLAVVLGEI